ncbi:MAG TPA: DUF2059 domain-containing protein [Pyrinomonadaceae bacterium]
MMKIRMSKAFIVSLFLCAGSLAVAQTPESEAKKQNIRKLLELTGGNKVASQVVDQQMEAVKKGSPGLPDRFWELMREEMRTFDVVEMSIPIYDKYLSEQEVKDLIVFYETPVGRKLIQVLPNMMQEIMNAVEPKSRAITQRVVERMKTEGYFKEPPPPPVRRNTRRAGRRTRG